LTNVFFVYIGGEVDFIGKMIEQVWSLTFLANNLLSKLAV